MEGIELFKSIVSQLGDAAWSEGYAFVDGVLIGLTRTQHWDGDEEWGKVIPTAYTIKFYLPQNDEAIRVALYAPIEYIKERFKSLSQK